MGLTTGHPLAGVLEAWHWHGKRISVDPNWVPMALLATEKPRARLRQISDRDRLSSAMVYDILPIIDVYRRLDANSLLGLMDAQGLEQPFFFTLQREASVKGETPLCPPAADRWMGPLVG